MKLRLAALAASVAVAGCVAASVEPLGPGPSTCDRGISSAWGLPPPSANWHQLRWVSWIQALVLVPTNAGEVWLYSLDEHRWSQLCLGGAALPSKGWVDAVVADESERRVLLLYAHFDGATQLSSWMLTELRFSETGRVVVANSSVLEPGPSAVFGAATAWDSTARRIHVVGGWGQSGAAPLTERWSLSVDAPLRWERIALDGDPPVPRVLASMVQAGGRLVYGGGFQDVQVFSDVWSLSLSSNRWLRVAGPWEQIPNSVAVAPGINDGQVIVSVGAAVWSLRDEEAQRLDSLEDAPSRHADDVVVAAEKSLYAYGGTEDGDYLGDLSEINFSTPPFGWKLEKPGLRAPINRDPPPVTSGAPGGRGELSLLGAAGAVVFSLNLASGVWTRTTPAMAPVPRASYASCEGHDGKIYLFGGGGGSGIRRSDLWSFDIENRTWEELRSPSQDAPAGADSASLVLAHERNQLVVFGGNTDSGTSRELWIFDLNAQAWRQAVFSEGPSARQAHASWVEQGQLWIAGGRAGGSSRPEILADVWHTGLDEVAWVQDLDLPSPMYFVSVAQSSEQVTLFGLNESLLGRLVVRTTGKWVDRSADLGSLRVGLRSAAVVDGDDLVLVPDFGGPEGAYRLPVRTP